MLLKERSQNNNMSVSAAAASSSKAQTVEPPAKPVEILQEQYSLIYANLHPVFLLSILLVNFRSLIQDPVVTLLGLAPTVTILQAIYCVLCLPSAGQVPFAAPKPGQKKKAAKPAQDIWAKIVVSHPVRMPFKQSLITIAAMLPLFAIDALPLDAAALHLRHPVWRTTHNASTAHHPAKPTPGTAHDPSTVLCTWP